MSLKLKKFEEEALRLPSRDRAQLAEYLIRSLDEEEDRETEKQWIEEAEQEMLDAAKYYESQASGLGIDYLTEIERAIEAIIESPMTWLTIEGELRRRLVRDSFWYFISY